MLAILIGAGLVVLGLLWILYEFHHAYKVPDEWEDIWNKKYHKNYNGKRTEDERDFFS